MPPRGKRRQIHNDVRGIARHARHIIVAPHRALSRTEQIAVLFALVLVVGLSSVAFFPQPEPREALPPPSLPGWEFEIPQVRDLHEPVRDEPRNFRARTTLPAIKEEIASGGPSPRFFYPAKDLIRIEDARVWWESDNDKNDTEDDHVFHRAMEEPMRRLIELVVRAGGSLEVHDAYRPEGIHAPKSLHREGRAVDITCDDLGLEKLAKLAWAAGFDWVYFEVPRNGGAHVHASVKADRRYVARSDTEE